MTVGENQLLEAGMITAEELASWKSEAAEEVQAAVATAQQEPAPNPYEDDWRVFSSPGLSDQH
jgi:TPP-dependent pyruvate/acetoin dehydrogenase alpha subunit